jgi:hypothetical protein
VLTKWNLYLRLSVASVLPAVLFGVVALAPLSSALANAPAAPTSTSSAASTQGSDSSSEAPSEAEMEAEEAALEAELEAEEAVANPEAKGTLTAPLGQGAKQTSDISGFRLARATMSALASHRVQAAQIHFLFTVAVAGKLRVVLALETVHDSHTAWRALDSLSINARRGNNSGALKATGSLPAGIYRLTLVPAGTAAHPAFLFLHAP